MKLSKLSFKNIYGTSATPNTMKIDCSKSFPCQNVEVSNIDIEYVGKIPSIATSTCDNVNPIISGKQIPKICATASSS